MLKINHGKIIVLEGTDGTGKGTQFKRLIARLTALEQKIVTFDFPQYKNPSAYFVEKYLRGEYGTAGEVSAKQASLFFALDRFDVAKEIKLARDSGNLVLMNRYIASNMGHQGAKIENREERKKFFEWLYELEFEILGVPRPDTNIILHLPAEIAQQNVDKKLERSYINAKRDIHEKDLTHLKRAEQVYLEIAELFPKEFKVIECMDGDRLLSEDEVEKKILTCVF